MHLCLGLVAFATFVLLVVANNKDSCEHCQKITQRFHEGLQRTAKANFGGGNTAWEEKHLGQYITSETRMVEINEGLCEYKDHNCFSLFEKSEEHIEAWWKANVTAEGVNGNLFDSLCVNRLGICCAEGRYGKNCKACPGGSATPCSLHGRCAGSGTRKGNGKCFCDEGYDGKTCNTCKDGHYRHELATRPEGNNVPHFTCQKCNDACTTCIGPDLDHCKQCKDGYELDSSDSLGCIDIDECVVVGDNAVCVFGEYCVNTPGKYECRDCHKSCDRSKGCSGEGPSACAECASGYTLIDAVCVDVDECTTTTSTSGPICDINYACVNTPGAFECQCQAPNTLVDGVCTPPHVEL